MKTTRTRKLLRISTFLAVSAGLAVGSTAMAATPVELAEEEPEDVEIGVEEQEEIDFPSAIEDFAEFLEEHREEGIEDVAEYTYEGTENMAEAMEEIIPGETRLFRDRVPEHAQEFEDQLDAWEDRIDELSDEEREDFAQVAHNILNDGAQWLTRVQESDYPALTDQVEAVQTAAGEIDPEADIEVQGEAIQSYFEASLTAIQDMYVAKEEDPLAGSPTLDLSYASAPDTMVLGDRNDEPIEEEPEVDPDVELTMEVQNYLDGIEELETDQLTGEEGEQLVVTNLRNLHDALNTFAEEEQPTEIEEIEGAQYDGEEEPGMEEEEPRMEEDVDPHMEEMTELQQELETQLEELEASVGEEEFTENMEETMEDTAKWLTDIQSEQFPQFEEEAEMVRDAAGDLDGDVGLDEQNEEVMEFFTQAANAVEAMDRERVDVPVTLLL